MKSLISIYNKAKGVFASVYSKAKESLTAICVSVKAFLSTQTAQRAFMFCLLCGLCVSVAWADGAAGITAIGEVTTQLKNYVEPVRKLLYAIAGIVALTGAISVYIKMNNEEQDVKKSIMLIVGACIFLIAAAEALPAFFGM